MKCSKCGLEISDDSHFCQYCGETLIEVKELKNDFKSNENKQTDSPQCKKAPKRNFKLKTMLIIVVALVLSTAIIVATQFFNPISFLKKSIISKASAPIIYSTENELFVVEKIGRNKESTKLIKISNNYAGKYLLSENYKYIVYSENVEFHDDNNDGENDRSTFDIYYKEVHDDNEGVLIAKNVSSLDMVLGDITKVIYGKNDDLYAFYIEDDNKKLAKDATFVGLSGDKKSAFCKNYVPSKHDYFTESDAPDGYDLKYVDLESGNVTKICDFVSSYSYKKDFSEIFYIKDGKLYSFGSDNEKKIVAKDVINCYVANDKLYYCCSDKRFYYYELVKDNYKSIDDNIKEPQWKDYAPDYENFQKEVYDEYWECYRTKTDYDSYNAAYDLAKDHYNGDLINYRNARQRQATRLYLDEISDYYTYSLYCFDGKTNKKIAENISDTYLEYIPNITSVGSLENDSISLCAYVYSEPLQDMKKIDITEVFDTKKVDEYLNNNIKYKKVIITSDGIIDLEMQNKDLSFANIFYDNNQYVIFYYNSTNEDADNIASVYTLPMGSKSIKEAKLLKEKVYGITYLDNKLISFCEAKQKYGIATLEFDGQKIDDVCNYGIMKSDKKDGFYYETDYDEKTGCGTVYYYLNGEKTKIADDIMFCSYFAEMDGKYLALTDYDYEDGEGTLVCIDDESIFQIDTNVKKIDNGGFKYLNCVEAYGRGYGDEP